jgi:hypothetical protein
MIILDIDIDTALAQAYFDYAGYHVRDARPPLTDVKNFVIIPAIRGQLSSRGVRGGKPYEPLSLDYEKRKAADGYGMEPILRRTGAMEMALFDEDAFHITSQHLDYEPDSEYAFWHQVGGYVFGRPPQREIIVLTTSDAEEIEDIFTIWLDDLRTANTRRGVPDANMRPGIPDVFIT